MLVEEGGRTMDPLENEIAQLIQNLRSIQNEQDYMMQREKMHARIAQRTNSRVRWWFLYQVALVAAAVVVEIFYLKSFFEKRRVV
jgi:type VI protein secretion system component VasF